ncbi:hypothetical protein M2371_004291 [Buttiauxella sp. BIGb0471]|uniref:hypothetical protein n=1 Tax=Buttiauxella sp. BIGb0471 TaxID=2940597 RepID=UPI002169EB16|nr:hypothetical protein [Buttiauxella sp. BIGb0471]MCS3605037.1 hypothetical protein [Buttiauxella sp. BIGb0471]
MATPREITDRRRVVILLANGLTAALAMDSEALDTAITDLMIEKVGHNDDIEIAEQIYKGVEAAMFAEAVQHLSEATK